MQPKVSPITPIERFEEGDGRTPWSAAVMNEIIDRLNLFIRMIGHDGIKVTYSDSNVVIGGHVSVTSSASSGGGSSSGSNYTFPWKGQYSTAENYVSGDIVRRNTDAEYDTGTQVGTFIAKKDCPAGSPEPNRVESEFWAVFAPFATQRFVMVADTGERIISNVRADDNVKIRVDNGSDTAAPSVDIALGDTRGTNVSLNLVNTCENGTPAQRVFLDSETPL
jgi:hypothetical protein